MKLGADVATALGERIMGAQINAAGVCKNAERSEGWPNQVNCFYCYSITSCWFAIWERFILPPRFDDKGKGGYGLGIYWLTLLVCYVQMWQIVVWSGLEVLWFHERNRFQFRNYNIFQILMIPVPIPVQSAPRIDSRAESIPSFKLITNWGLILYFQHFS